MAKDDDDDADRRPDDEAGLFRRTVSDAVRLKPAARVPEARRAPARARFSRRDEREVLAESLGADVDEASRESGDALRFHRPSVGRRTFRRLARGGYSVQSELDLHGLTVAEAREALQDFIEESCRQGHTCVRIVHGKGLGSGQRGPVLKGKVDRWLRRWDPVLAFSSARQVDGGTGAVYVLLRKA